MRRGAPDAEGHPSDLRADRVRWRKLGAGAIVLAAPWVVLLCYSLQAALPSNPVKLPAQHRLLLFARQVLPEGWSFFTRDPREKDVLLFTRSPERRWGSAHVGPYARPRWVFGWSRRPRAQGLELGLLLASVTKDDWRPCDAIDACLGSAEGSPSVVVENISPVPTLCGDLALVSAEPVPWAWARNLGRFHQPQSVVFVHAEC